MKHFRGKKIFYLFDTALPVENLWQMYHFVDELKKYETGFILFNKNDYHPYSYEDELIKKIKSAKNEIALFFTGNTDRQISVSTITEINKMGIPTLLICYDNLSVPYNHQHVAPYFSLVWLTSYETEYLFKKWSAKTIVLPYAANPARFFPVYENEIPAVGFIGSLYGARGFKIKVLSDQGIPLCIYSGQHLNDHTIVHHTPGITDLPKKITETLERSYYLIRFIEGRKLLLGDLCKAFLKRINKKIIFNNQVEIHESVSFEEMNRLYSNFALSLGIIEAWNTYLLKNPVLKLHLRSFEIPMCGGLQVTNYNQEIEQYFQDGKEIILYKSNEEMIDKIRFFLKDENQSLRKQIKNAARIRSEKDHTWFERFNRIHNTLFS